MLRNFSIPASKSDTLPVIPMMYSADMAIASAATNGSIKDLEINLYKSKMKDNSKLLIYIVVWINSTGTENNWSFEIKNFLYASIDAQLNICTVVFWK